MPAALGRRTNSSALTSDPAYVGRARIADARKPWSVLASTAQADSKRREARKPATFAYPEQSATAGGPPAPDVGTPWAQFASAKDIDDS